MEFAVTVIGSDRIGIVAEVAGALAALGANLTDSTMTRLRGHFTMTLICTADAGVGDLEAALRPLSDLTITVREVGPDVPLLDAGEPYVLSVYGADRLGIVAAVTRAVADAGGNITDLSTRLSGPLYLLIAEFSLEGRAEALTRRLAELEDSLGVEISLRSAEADML